MKGLTVAALTGLLSACGGPKESDKPAPPTGAQTTPTATGGQNWTFKVITNGISPFWNSMGKGLDAAKAELKCGGDWVGPQNAEHNAQVKLMKEAVAAKIDGIAVSAIEADALTGTINEAIDAGVPVITFDSDAPKSKRLVYIGTNNFEAGRMAGEEAARLFPNGAKLVAFVGNMSAANARERYEGFKAAVKGKNIEFVQEPYEDNKDKGRARRNAEDALTRYKDKISGLVGLYSYNGPAIVAAVQAANLRSKMKIVCFDGEPDTLRNLGQGLVDVTVVQKPYEFGRLSIKLLYLYKQEKDIDKALEKLKPELDTLNMKLNGHILDTGVEVITPANAQPFLQKLKEKGLEST